VKILNLKLIAYGSFTDTRLNFDDDGIGFHLVYGPNEAGKSTALNALRHLLFGIPERTSAGFLHPRPRLRIGGKLMKSDGAQIEFVRRKGRSKTLRDADDRTPLDDAALLPFLGGLDPNTFEQMFAIGHAELVRGGEEIVAGAGHVGESLFTAGAGLVQLQRIRRALDAICGGLFKPGGSKPVINRVLAELKRVQQNENEALLPAGAWKEHDRALTAAREKIARVGQQLMALKTEKSRLDRIARALPLMARLREIDEAAAGLRNIPDLDEDFSQKWRQAAGEMEIARTDLSRITAAIGDLKKQLNKNQPPDNVIAHAAQIEHLQRDQGGYRKALAARPGLDARRRALIRQTAEKLTETTLDEGTKNAGGPALPPSVIADVQDLYAAHERLVSRQEAAETRRRKCEARQRILETDARQLPDLADLTALSARVKAIQAAGPLEERYREQIHELDTRQATLDTAVKRFPFLSGYPDKIDTARCPVPETVDHFDRILTATTTRIDRRLDERQAATEELLRIQTDLEAIRRDWNVPSAADLAAARAVRRQGWDLIRAALDNRPPPENHTAFTEKFDGHPDLTTAFEKSMHQADHIADRLRREAEQVSRRSVFEARRQAIEQKIVDIDADLAATRAEQTEIEDRWRKIWEPVEIIPRSPLEMRRWLADLTAIREKIDALRAEKIKAAGLAEEIAALRAQLAQDLKDAGQVPDPSASLAVLVTIAAETIDARDALQARADKIMADRDAGRREMAEIDTELAGLSKTRARWEAQWTAGLQAIGVAPSVRPAAAMRIVDNIRDAKRLADETEVLKKQIDSTDREIESFQNRLRPLIEDLDPCLLEAAPPEATEKLHARLISAREQLALRKNFEARLAALTAEQKDAARQTTAAQTRLADLCRQACCQNPDEIEGVITRARRRRRLLAERDTLESRVRELGAGATVAAFTAEAGTVTADRISPELDRITAEITALESERSVLDQTIGTERTELEKMDGSARAGGYAEQKQQLLADLDTAVETYARHKIAMGILTRTIEQYREKHQGPLIRRSGELFARMSAGSFTGIRAEYDAKGQPVLVGIRANGGRIVPVAGMSDGTADQLYLALRLASLEQYLTRHEPLPFIVDDILLRFDDNRAAATLKVIAGLARKTQVIFFTHHAHLVDLARDAISPKIMKQYELT